METFFVWIRRIVARNKSSFGALLFTDARLFYKIDLIFEE